MIEVSILIFLIVALFILLVLSRKTKCPFSDGCYAYGATKPTCNDIDFSACGEYRRRTEVN